MYQSDMNPQYIESIIERDNDCEKCGMVDDTHLERMVETQKPKKSTLQFWTQNPNVLFDSQHITEFFPTGDMSYEQKLNAITRTVIILTIISFAYTRKTHILMISLITLLAIVLLHYTQTNRETFMGVGYKTTDNNVPQLNEQYRKWAIPIESKGFYPPNAGNPFGNVLLPDYEYNPDKLPAIPIYTKEGYDKTLEQAKQMVVQCNPGQTNIAEKLFTDLGDQLVFEQSMQPFYTNPSTSIPNDQAAFADFCYGSMISSKEGNMQALERNSPHRHTLN